MSSRSAQVRPRRADSQRIDVLAKVVLDQRLDEEIAPLLLVAGPDGPDDRWQLHHRGLDGRSISTLTCDQYVIAVLGGANANRLQAAVSPD